MNVYVYNPAKLKNLRASANISAADVSTSLYTLFGKKITNASLFNWEAGLYTPQADILGLIVSLYGASPNDVFDVEPISAEQKPLVNLLR